MDCPLVAVGWRQSTPDRALGYMSLVPFRSLLLPRVLLGEGPAPPDRDADLAAAERRPPGTAHIFILARIETLSMPGHHHHLAVRRVGLVDGTRVHPYILTGPYSSWVGAGSETKV